MPDQIDAARYALSWASAVDARTGRPIENPKPLPIGDRHRGDQVPLARAAASMAFSPNTGFVAIPFRSWPSTGRTTRALRSGPVAGIPVPFTRHFDVQQFVQPSRSVEGLPHRMGSREGPRGWRVEHKGAWNGGTLATLAASCSSAIDGASSRWTPYAVVALVGCAASALAGPITLLVNERCRSSERLRQRLCADKQPALTD